MAVIIDKANGYSLTINQYQAAKVYLSDTSGNAFTTANPLPVVLSSSSIEGVTATQGAAGAQAWKVDGSGVTQPVSISGALTVTQGASGASAWKVDGSGVTQPISGSVVVSSLPSIVVSSLPALPTGANTIGVVNQGASGTQAWKIDGSGVTQPISGSVTLNGGTNTIGVVNQGQAGTSAWKIDGSAVTQPISGSVSATIAGTGGIVLDASLQSIIGASAPGTPATKSMLLGGLYLSTSPTASNGQQVALLMDSGGRAIVNINAMPSVTISNFPATQPVSGNVSATITNFPATQPVSIAGTVATQTQGLNTPRMTVVGVGTSAAQLVTALASRVSVGIKAYNNNTGLVYVGFSSSVSATTGWPLGPGESLPADFGASVALWAIAASGTQNVAVLEVAP